MRATRLDAGLFDDLAATTGSHLGSVFLPTHKKSRDVAQDRIRLKNQLREVDESLAALGWKARQRTQRLDKALGLLNDRDFWEHQEEGLAVYIDDAGEVVPVSTARALQTSSWLLPVFMVRPLVSDLYPLALPVLVLTRHEVALFSTDRFGVDPIQTELPSHPDANWFVDREKERQQRPDAAGTEGGHHGHDPSDQDDADLVRFLREVDAALGPFDDETPLITLGDDDLVSRFADVSGRAPLSPPNSGIRAPFTPEEIVDSVGELVVEVEHRRLESAKAEAREKLGVGMATADIRDAIPAAVSGRVDRVVVDRTASPIWGRLDESALDVDIHEARATGDVDLLDRLIVWARRTAAEIVAAESAVDHRPFVATFRY